MSRGPKKKYWRSLAEWSRDSAYPNRQQDESPPPEGPFPMDRRRFFALLGASAALGTTACGAPADREKSCLMSINPRAAPPALLATMPQPSSAIPVPRPF